MAAPAKKIEALGFESLYISERKHEPFMQLAIAATATSRIELRPEVALAFPRNPTVLAYTTWDLQGSTNGRFILGLGTQVKAHNERREHRDDWLRSCRAVEYGRYVNALRGARGGDAVRGTRSAPWYG